MLCPNMSTIIRSKERIMNVSKELIISKWNRAQSAITNVIESYEYIKIWLLCESDKGEVNDHSVLMTAITRQALPGCCGVWIMVVDCISKYQWEQET